jgi:hypothetical protein
MGCIRAELAVESPADCPIARASETGGTATSVIKSVPADPDEPVTEEFVLDGNAETLAAEESVQFKTVFAYGDERVYRFGRSQHRTCFCACIEQFDRSVTSTPETAG